uniref:carbonic anhydrase n=1 Tax=Meloidogyne javanica TaxID=6303 RepID=A0A915MU11_MELJA
VQFVHRSERYTQEEAKKKPDGFAVLAVFLELGRVGNSMANLEIPLQKIVKFGSKVNIKGFKIDFIFPEDEHMLLHIHRYKGSFTTPECNEAVNWIIFPESYQFTRRQLNLLRAIEGPVSGKPLVSNVRPTQPLNGRKILTGNSDHCPP